MSGSALVNAKLTATVAGMLKGCEAAMDQHIIRSKEYAVANKPWKGTGITVGGIKGVTNTTTGEIKSSVCHDGDPPIGVYLEKAWFFQGRYKILERARSNNLVGLWAHLRSIMSGAGFIRGG